MRKEKARKKATSRRDKPKQEEVDNDNDGDGDGDSESIDDKDLDIVARMDDILKTYERTRRQWFWHNSSESTKNLANFNMKGMRPPFFCSFSVLVVPTVCLLSPSPLQQRCYHLQRSSSTSRRSLG